MGSFGAILKHPDDFYPLLKLKYAMKNAEKQIPPEPHWAFCYSMLHKVSRSFGLVIQQLGPQLRDAVSLSRFTCFCAEISAYECVCVCINAVVCRFGLGITSIQYY